MTLPAPDAPFEVPVVDIGAYRCAASAADRGAVAARMDAACAGVGFVQVVGHGVPRETVDGLAAALDDFFGLPLEQKKHYRVEGANRGYSPPRSESLSRSLGVEAATRDERLLRGLQRGHRGPLVRRAGPLGGRRRPQPLARRARVPLLVRDHIAAELAGSREGHSNTTATREAARVLAAGQAPVRADAPSTP